MNLRDILEYAPLVTGVIVAVLGLITAALSYLERRAKPVRISPSASDDGDEKPFIPPGSWLTSRRIIPWLIVFATIFLIALLLLLILPKRPNRHVEILRPQDTVNISQKSYNDRGDYYYTFVVAGRCPDCDQDEWVQLFVLPPQGGAYVTQDGVPVLDDDTWEATVKIGDRNNPIINGDKLLMQAVVIHEKDLIDVTTRLTNPRRANERGLSKLYRLTVRIDQ